MPISLSVTTETSSDLKAERGSAPGVVSNHSMNGGTVFAACFLAIFAFGCYYSSLFSGLVCDDYNQYAYFLNALETEPLRLLQNCVGSWLQAPLRELHYRPFLLLPHLFDCIVFRFNSVGYHLTNIVIHCTSTLLVFFIARAVLTSLANKAGLIIPLMAGILFAAHPLHADAVSWISGRSESFCALLYLSSVLLFLKHKTANSQSLRFASYCFCFFAMLTKEKAVTLPAVLAWYCLCLNLGSLSWRENLKSALRETSVYWALLFSYLTMRWLALGTMFGGYAGLTNKLTDLTWVQNVFNVHSYEKVFLPIPSAMAYDSPILVSSLLFLHYALTITCLLRIGLCKLDSKFIATIAFAIGWMMLSFIPIAGLWHGTDGLAGGRHFYLVSVPFCIFVMLSIIPSESDRAFPRLLRMVAVSLTAAYCGILATITIQQHRLWTDAHLYSNAFRDAIVSHHHSRPDAERLVVLNVPISHKTITLNPNFYVLKGLFSKPLCQPDLSQKISLLRPDFYNNVNLLNKSALREALNNSSTSVLFWDSKNCKIGSVPPAYFSNRDGVYTPASIHLIENSDVVKTYEFFPTKPLQKEAIDCLEVLVDCAQLNGTNATQSRSTMILSWEDEPDPKRLEDSLIMVSKQDGSLAMYRDGANHKLARSILTGLKDDGRQQAYRFHLSELTDWVLSGQVSKLRLMILSEDRNFSIKSAAFLNLAGEIPQLSVVGESWRRNQDGTVSPVSANDLPLLFDASKIPGASQVVAEVSWPDFVWECSVPSYRQKKLSDARQTRVALQGVKGEFKLLPEIFPRHADYQVHIAALDNRGKMLGYVSDPVTIHLSKDVFAKAKHGTKRRGQN